MIKIDNFEVFNLRGAIFGMRNPLESWGKSDSEIINGEFIIGNTDKELAFKLIKAGSDHRKFMRQILVSVDITAPMTWWWDMDTYKVASVKNSTSRMHKLGSRSLTPADFSWDDQYGYTHITPLRQYVLNDLNERILKFQRLKKENEIEAAMYIWRDIILDLPDSYNFYSTWTGNYEILRNIYHSRKNHKQHEFHTFCNEIEKMPYSEFITTK